MKLAALALAQGLALVFLASCGSGQRQDSSEPAGNYRIAVTDASFPVSQTLSQSSQLVISVRNTDTKTAPNIAVTVKGFDYRKQQADLADPRRPLLIVDRAPPGGDTAYTDTYALGPLAPGQTKTFIWQVTALHPGPFNISYVVSAGLSGKARAVNPSGQPVGGSFVGAISSTPAPARVDASGHVVQSP